MPVEMVVGLAVYIVCWQGYELRRRLTGFGQLVLFVVVVAGVVNPAVQRMFEAGWFGDADTTTARFTGTVIVTVNSVALYLFRLAVDGHGPRSRRVLRATGLGVAVLAAEFALYLGSRADGLSMLYGTAAFAHWRGAVYFAFTGFYFFALNALVLVWIVRRTREAGPLVRFGVRVAGVGMMLAGLVAGFRSIPPFLALFGGPLVAPPGWVLFVASTAGTPLMVAGLSLPLVVGRVRAFRAWRGHRRDYQRIEPLWTLSRTAYPGVVLPPDGSGRLPMDYRLRRRRAECLDALHQLRSGDPGPDGERGRAADRLRAAVAAVEPAPPDGDDQRFLERLADSLTAAPAAATPS